MTPNSPVGAVPKIEPRGDIHDGTFVALSGDMLEMSTVDNERCSFRLAPDVFICSDDIPCRIQDLKGGCRIRLTTQVDDKSKATHIEALVNKIDFADHH